MVSRDLGPGQPILRLQLGDQGERSCSAPNLWSLDAITGSESRNSFYNHEVTQHCQVTSVESQLTTASDTVSANFLLPSPVIKPAPEECNGHNDFLKAQGLRSLVPMVTYTNNQARGQRNIPSAEIAAAPEWWCFPY